MRTTLTRAYVNAVARINTAHNDAIRNDDGDVPGWVLITVMTAGLVTAIWLVADDQLTAVLNRAIGSISTP